jgi:alpha-beta hydrolase superfamily lysophospholipase
MNSSAKAGLSSALPPTEWLTGGDGKRLATSFYPAPAPWLNVLISHGFAEHRGWWHHVAAALQAGGCTVLTFDHYCHGQSDGVPGDVPHYGVLSDGLRLALEGGLLPRGGGRPTVLLGHSNGGLAALRTLPQIRGSLAGVVLGSPLLGVPWRNVVMGWPVATLLALRDPAAFWPVQLRPWRLTHNEAIWPEYNADPLRFHRISARFFLNMVRESRAAARTASCQGLPLLLLSAGEDVVVSLGAMGRWYSRVGSSDKQRSDKQRLHYPHDRHELFNEADWTLVLQDVLGWLQSRFRPKA